MMKSLEKYKLVKSLGQIKYLSAMKYSKLLIGNSSSGIIEAASFKKPVVNIGDRQKGRLTNNNVINCQIDSLIESISQALSDDFLSKCKTIKNIYGSGNSSNQIVNEIIKQNLSVKKVFYNQN